MVEIVFDCTCSPTPTPKMLTNTNSFTSNNITNSFSFSALGVLGEPKTSSGDAQQIVGGAMHLDGDVETSFLGPPRESGVSCVLPIEFTTNPLSCSGTNTHAHANLQLVPGGCEPFSDRESDNFVAPVLAVRRPPRLGGNMKRAQDIFTDSSESERDTSPPRRDPLQLELSGWRSAATKSEDLPLVLIGQAPQKTPAFAGFGENEGVVSFGQFGALPEHPPGQSSYNFGGRCGVRSSTPAPALSTGNCSSPHTPPSSSEHSENYSVRVHEKNPAASLNLSFSSVGSVFSTKAPLQLCAFSGGGGN